VVPDGEKNKRTRWEKKFKPEVRRTMEHEVGKCNEWQDSATDTGRKELRRGGKKKTARTLMVEGKRGRG